MKRIKMLIAATAVCLVACAASDALAQKRSSRYQNRSISRPSTSSYLNLLQGGYGYGQYGLTDPLLAPYLRQNQSTASRRQPPTTTGGTSVGLTSPSVNRARAARGTRSAGVTPSGVAGSGVAPTGTGSVFMQYSHYFQLSSQGGRRR